MLECCGCGEIKLRSCFRCTEFDSPEIRYYPPIAIRRLPRWIGELPPEIQEILKEAYLALHTDCRRLAVMGAGTLFDMTAIKTVGDVGTFDQKLEAMENEGYLGKRDKEHLSAVLETRNAASHRGHNPTKDDVDKVMDIVENLLHRVFVLEKASRELKQVTPPRRQRAKGGP